MDLPDVNVLVGAFREDLPHHDECAGWLRRVGSGIVPFGVTDLALSGFLRIVTSSRLFDGAATPAEALAFTRRVRTHRNCVVIAPGARHWSIFEQLCDLAGARGNLIPDAYFAAIAIESGSDWITLDRDFRRFPGLSYRRPGD